MPQLFYFILKVILCSGILFGYYHLFLKNKVYHAYNRYYLLFAVVVSLLVPLISFDIYNGDEQTKLKPIQILQAVNSSDAYIEEIIITSHSRNIEFSDLLIVGYVAIAFAFFVSFMILLFRMYALIRSSDKSMFSNIILINSTAKGTPFSFFRYLFWNKEIDMDTETGRHIFSHELAHIREKHSIDKMLMNVVLIICWINPFFWLIRKELNMIHEFIADKKAVGEYDTALLASMIIHTSYPKHHFLITNHFFYSPIKRRLEMLAKYRSTRASYFTRILALPILFVLVAAFTFKTKQVLKPAAFTADNEYVVVIDAGHGGQDGGAKALDGTNEKDVNLALARMVKGLNKNNKIKIILTRESDVYQKPQEKAEIANALKADLFISIHVSNTPENFRNISTGMEVYVAKDEFPNSASSKLFASVVISTFASDYKLKVKSNPQQSKTGIWVLQASNCPAVLIEAGFISNKNDKAYLTSAEGMNTFANNVLSSINRYISEVDEVNLKALQPTIVEGPFNGVLVNDVKQDTLPKNQSSTEITVIDDAEFIIRSDQDASKENSIIVIGDKVYDVKMLTNKVVIGKRAKLYGKNNKDIIKRYGKRGKDGAIIFESGTIKDLPTGKYDVVIDRQNQNMYTDASQRLNEKSIKFNEEKKNLDARTIIVSKGLDSLNQPLYLLDGEIILQQKLKALDPSLIKSIHVLKGVEAELQYGVDAKNGAVLIATKKLEALELEGKKLEMKKLNGSFEEIVIDGYKLSPTNKQAKAEITLSGIIANRIPINRLKDIKSVQINMPGYKVISGTIYFVGAGFPNVTTASLNGESLEQVATFLKRVQAGTSITFDNVVIEDANGKRSTIGKGFSFVPEANSIQP